MTEITPPSAPITPETTESSPLVVKPFVSSKPYDDDMFEAYEEEEAKEEEAKEEAHTEAPLEEAKSDETPPEEEVESKEEEPNSEGLEETKITKAINGKQVDFKVKDAIQAYVKQEEFNRNMDKRITHISQREQRWTQDQNQFKDKIGKLVDTAQNGDFVTSIRALAKLAVGTSGLDVTEFEKKYFDQLDKVREVYTKMTPEQRDAYFSKRALAEANARTKQLEEEKTVGDQTSQLKEHVETLQKQHGIGEDEFWNNYQALESALVGEGRVFNTLHDVKAEDIINFSLRVRHEEKILQAGEELGIKDDRILDEVSRITLANPELTVEDVVTIIETSGVANIAPSDVVENLNRKAGRSQSNRASSTKKADGKIEGIDKEEIDFLYRKQPKVFARPAR